MNKSIEDPDTRERVLKVARLVLDGHSKKEVSEILNISEKVVERDISSRLLMLSEIDDDYKIYYDAVINCLHKNQVKTIENNRKKYK